MLRALISSLFLRAASTAAVGESSASSSLAEGQVDIVSGDLSALSPEAASVPRRLGEAPSTAGCFVQRADGRILVVKHSWGAYDIPGGMPNDWEIPEQTAARETMEETGYRVWADKLLSVRQSGFHVYRCHLLSPVEGGFDLREVQKVLWLEPEKLPSKQPWRFPDEVSDFVNMGQRAIRDGLPELPKHIWICHFWTPDDSKQLSEGADGKDVCEDHSNESLQFAYTVGVDEDWGSACLGCLCCKRHPRKHAPARRDWSCYEFQGADLDLIEKGVPERKVCERERTATDFDYASNGTEGTCGESCKCCRRPAEESTARRLEAVEGIADSDGERFAVDAAATVVV